MANKADIAFKLTNDIHEDVTRLYEASADGETEESLNIIEEIQRKVKHFKINLTKENE